MAQAADTETRIKVFISYSRADKAFASDLVLGLAACGFAPYIDRQDIAAGEDWEKRLAGLISEADSVVYVITPDSLGSENCAEEFRQAIALRKRVLPVVWRPVDDAAAPPEMKRLNYIFFTGEGRTFAAGLADLAAALRTDIDWIREHTRLAELGRRWSARGRTSELLLRGDDVDAARSWMAGKPIAAPAITDEQADFIKASSDARAETERRARRARTGLLVAVSVAATIFASLAAAAGWMWQAADAAGKDARKSRDAAIAANRSLEGANLRLDARIGLRTPPTGERYFEIAGSWFPIAARYSGSVVRIEVVRFGFSTFGSAFIIKGTLVHPDYADETLLLLPELTVDSTSGIGSEAPTLAMPNDVQATLPKPSNAPSGLYVTFPALAETEPLFIDMADDPAAFTPEHMGGIPGFSAMRLKGALPFGARPIELIDVDCSAYQGAAYQPASALTAETIAMFGVPGTANAQDRGATLFVSEMRDASDPYNLVYSHSTDRGAVGSAVFSLVSGRIAGVHLGSRPPAPGETARTGYGVSLPLLLDVLRSNPFPERPGAPSVCEAQAATPSASP